MRILSVFLAFLLFGLNSYSQSPSIDRANKIYEAFITDLVDQFRKPFKDKMDQMVTNFPSNRGAHEVVFYSSDASVCHTVKPTNSDVVVGRFRFSEFLKTVGSEDQVQYNLDYFGCNQSQKILTETFRIHGTKLMPMTFDQALKFELRATLDKDETYRSYRFDRLGRRIAEIQTRRETNGVFTQFFIDTTPIITIAMRVRPDGLYVTLQAHEFTHTYINSSDSYRFKLDEDHWGEQRAEIPLNTNAIKYLEGSRIISKKDFDELFRSNFISPLQKSVGRYFHNYAKNSNSFFPRTELLRDATGGTKFLDDIKRSLVQLNNNDVPNVIRFLQKTIGDIEEGRLRVTEQNQN